MKFHYKINIEPVPWARPRFNRSTGAVFNKSENVKYRAQIRSAIPALPIPIKDPVILTAKFYFTKPKRQKNLVKSTRPDLSNLIKEIEDALNGIVWHDDGIIFSYGTGTGKYYTDGPPYIEFWAETLT